VEETTPQETIIVCQIIWQRAFTSMFIEEIRAPFEVEGQKKPLSI